MSYTLTPIIIDLNQVRSFTGSKNTAVPRPSSRSTAKRCTALDDGDELFEDFEDESKAEYKAFAAGDFSNFDLNQK